MDKRLYEALKKADPSLRIIQGGVRRRSLSPRDWERAAGEICSQCGREYFRGHDGLCYDCWEKKNEFEIRDKAGALAFLPESVIFDIVHPAKKE